MLQEKSTKYDNFDSEVDITRTFLCSFGLWPGTTFFSIMSLFFIKEIIGKSMESIGWVAYILLVVIEMCLMRNNIHFISSIIQRMDDNWKCIHDIPIEDKETMHRYVIKSRRIVRFTILLISTCAGGYILQPYISTLISGQKIPNKVLKIGWYPYSLTSLSIILATNIVTIICIIISVLIFVSIDTCLISMTLHCAGQWAVLCNTIREYKGVLKHSVDNNDLSLVNLIRRFTIIESVQTRNFTEFTLQIFYDFWTIFSLFTYCWLGELLSKKNEQIEKTSFEVDWINQKPKISRALMLILIQARNQPQLTAGNFFILTLSFYKQCIKASVSYLSVLIAIGLGKLSSSIKIEKKLLTYEIRIKAC
ncbi:uncharacterized protein [Chelonus insularis]|uniref:uncharacterized protein n=1 Tax=Chelonus insularis TaxID=460826 RepID=UPI00158C340C|nr:uncharacterized protein LOC118070004 [Chelonus insularis]